jgi:hypothetical protein
VDLIGELVPQDLVTVARYSTTHRPDIRVAPQFLRGMVRKYLDIYYVYDRFISIGAPMSVPGSFPSTASPISRSSAAKYIAEFLGQSVICDEVGVLLNDGPGWCLGIFLDRSTRRFGKAEIGRLETRFPVFAALHELDIRARSPGFMRTAEPAAPAEARQVSAKGNCRPRYGLSSAAASVNLWD